MNCSINPIFAFHSGIDLYNISTDIDCNNNNIAYHGGIFSHDVCVGLCNENVHCVAYVFVQHTCHLKSKCLEFQPLTGSVTARKSKYDQNSVSSSSPINF